MNPLLTSGAAAGLVIILAACGSSPSQPAAATSTTSSAVATAASPPPAVRTTAVMAEAITIGTTGVRCFVGNMSAACAATTRPFKDGDHRYWTAVFSLTGPTALEPGFQPGEPIDPSQLEVGDLALSGGTIGVITAIGPDPQVGLGSRVVNIREVAGGRSDFGGFYRPIPDAFSQDVNPGQPLTVRDWKFTLTGTTLRIDNPNGSRELDT